MTKASAEHHVGLSECPFCGDDVQDLEVHKEDGSWLAEITCACGGQMNSSGDGAHDSEASAIEDVRQRWNCRAT
jgi:hypothetical protein